MSCLYLSRQDIFQPFMSRYISNLLPDLRQFTFDNQWRVLSWNMHHFPLFICCLVDITTCRLLYSAPNAFTYKCNYLLSDLPVFSHTLTFLQQTFLSTYSIIILVFSGDSLSFSFNVMFGLESTDRFYSLTTISRVFRTNFFYVMFKFAKFSLLYYGLKFI